jgi:hypothetical protein
MVTLAVLAVGLGTLGRVGAAQGQVGGVTSQPEKPMSDSNSGFYCNMNALSPAERAAHKQLTEKLIETRKNIVEVPRGYEFQFAPTAVSVTELAGWVIAEAKCCPFFDFHIDLERRGSVVCLRLTGEDGIKPFIRGEFLFAEN